MLLNKSVGVTPNKNILRLPQVGNHRVINNVPRWGIPRESPYSQEPGGGSVPQHYYPLVLQDQIYNLVLKYPSLHYGGVWKCLVDGFEEIRCWILGVYH